jgi:hypothetical protein
MILEGKISDELLSQEDVLAPIRERINKDMYIYGDTSFVKYILEKATYFSLEHAVHLSEDDRLALYKLLKLNNK